MSDLRSDGWFRRVMPQTFRVRLSLIYAALFLAAGATLLGLTYGLVASSLPTAPSVPNVTKNQAAKLGLACKRAAGGLSPKGFSSATPTPSSLARPQATASPLPAACKQLYAAGASAAASLQRDQTLQRLLWFSLLGLGAVTIASGGLGWVMAGRVLRPVRAITGAARRASGRNLGERLALQGPRDELKELGDTFDGMLDRLDAAFASQRRFVADASHELRTPLTVMRTAIDVTLAKPARTPQQLEAMAIKVRRSADQAEALINALLTLAMSERGVASSEFVDLATIAEDAIDLAQPALAQLGLHVETALEPAEASGDRLLLERLAANLVDNAVRHNIPAGWVRVRTGPGNDASVFIEVANSGPVIPGDLLPSLFEPFRRIEERTSTHDGVGLGLAIVKSVSAAHGAHLEAHSQPGGGLVISVVIPRNSGAAMPPSSDSKYHLQ